MYLGFSTRTCLKFGRCEQGGNWTVALLFAHQAKKWELLIPTQLKGLWWVFHSSIVEVRSLNKDTGYLPPGTLPTAPPDLLCPEMWMPQPPHWGLVWRLCSPFSSNLPLSAHLPLLLGCCGKQSHCHHPFFQLHESGVYTSVLHSHVLSGCAGCLLNWTDVQRTWLWLWSVDIRKVSPEQIFQVLKI